MKNNYIIPIFVPHIGCPNDCVFCNQRKITGISTDINGNDVKNKIEEYLKTIPEDDRNLEIAFFGGSFTGIDTEIQKAFLDIANSYKIKGIVNQIRLSTRPDYIDRERLDILKERGVDIIELGVQSLDEEVIEKSNRGHSKESVYTAASLINSYGFILGVQMMIGLPGDTEEKALKTADALISLNPKIARIYPTLVVSETQLETDYLNGDYKPLSLYDAVNLSKKLLLKFENAGINVIRIGLQPSDNIAEDGDIVAGPFHPSFRQLVEEQIYYDVTDKLISDYLCSEYWNSEVIKLNRIDSTQLKTSRFLIIEASPKLFSYIAGQRKRNIDNLIEKYGLKGIKLYPIGKNADLSKYDLINDEHDNLDNPLSLDKKSDKYNNVKKEESKDILRVYFDNNDKIIKKDEHKNIKLPILEKSIKLLKKECEVIV